MGVVFRLLGCVLFAVSMALVLFALVRDLRRLPLPVLRALLLAIPISGICSLLCWAVSAMVGE